MINTIAHTAKLFWAYLSQFRLRKLSSCGGLSTDATLPFLPRQLFCASDHPISTASCSRLALIFFGLGSRIRSMTYFTVVTLCRTVHHTMLASSEPTPTRKCNGDFWVAETQCNILQNQTLFPKNQTCVLPSFHKL